MEGKKEGGKMKFFALMDSSGDCESFLLCEKHARMESEDDVCEIKIPDPMGQCRVCGYPVTILNTKEAA